MIARILAARVFRRGKVPSQKRRRARRKLRLLKTPLRDQFLVSDLWLTRIASESEKNFSNSKGLLSMTKNQSGVQLGSLHCQPHAERLILPTLRRPRAIRCFFHNAVSHQNGRFTIRTVVPVITNSLHGKKSNHSLTTIRMYFAEGDINERHVLDLRVTE